MHFVEASFRRPAQAAGLLRHTFAFFVFNFYFRSMTMKKTSSLAALAGALALLGSQAAVAHDGHAVQGEAAVKTAAKKSAEGACGEGKCGAAATAKSKAAEGKCGEGKCGAAKKQAKKPVKAKAAEGKCGEGKCGSK
ncbi:hypothetical protein HMPREF9120_01030 [Neisseria sp. oral taxon 020 str. F0370]|nr:hypothetical protein HMPREF9120_01030 [Neisseria sp. oral taxon 020 str. F0370]